MKTFIRARPLAAYFALAYGIAWGGVLLVAATRGFQWEGIGLADIGLMFLAMLAGPSLSGILLTAALQGRQGLREMLGRMGRWRVAPGWYAVALGTIPLNAIVILSTLAALYGPAYRPGFTPFLFALGLAAGFLEEIGWTGFALPRLRKRFSMLGAGLVLGVLWALWHAAADFAGNFGALGGAWFLHFFVFWIAPLTAYRILMVWVYGHTGSLLLAQLMHAGYTGSLLMLSPSALAPAEGLVWQMPFALALWMLVGIVAARSRQAARPGAQTAR